MNRQLRRIAIGIAVMVVLSASSVPVSADAASPTPAIPAASPEDRNALPIDWSVHLIILAATVGIAVIPLAPEPDSTAMLESLQRWLPSQATPIIVTDNEGHLLCFSDQVGNVLAIEWGNLSGTTDAIEIMRNHCADEESHAALTRLQHWLPGRAMDEIEPVIVTTANQRPWKIMLVPQFAGLQRPAYWLWMFQDASMSLRLEQHESHSTKMEAISRFAGGMAHEFNNLLTVMLGNLELMRADLQRPVTAVVDRINAAEKAAMRANQLIGELRRFASRDATTQTRQSLIPVVDRVRDELSALSGDHVEVTTSFDPADAERMAVKINAQQLEEALLKLGVNAIEAIGEEKGGISFEIRIVNLSGTDLLQIVICDTGGGMNPETRDRAFEPFFTTKDPTSASGLGMAIAYGLIEEMRGVVQIAKSSGAGTEVCVTFPVESEPATTAAEDSESHLVATRSLLIAVVHDSSTIRSMSKAMLRLLVHRTELFSNAADLLNAVKAGRRYDVILLSHSLSATSSTPTFLFLRGGAQPAPIILLAEDTTDLDAFCAEAGQRPDALLLTPFSVSDLSTALASFAPQSALSGL